MCTVGGQQLSLEDLSLVKFKAKIPSGADPNVFDSDNFHQKAYCVTALNCKKRAFFAATVT